MVEPYPSPRHATVAGKLKTDFLMIHLDERTEIQTDSKKSKKTNGSIKEILSKRGSLQQSLKETNTRSDRHVETRNAAQHGNAYHLVTVLPC